MLKKIMRVVLWFHVRRLHRQLLIASMHDSSGMGTLNRHNSVCYTLALCYYGLAD